jgi:1-acyl-sn-glycerol-3-phosphate acyltransferase
VHFRVPVWWDLVSALGMVEGTRENTRELMRRDELVLVYPGGGRELTKGAEEQYRLIWKGRLGFARLAIESGYPVVPFAAVGAEHALDVLVDSDHPTMAPARWFFRTVLGSPDIPPIARGIGPTPVPRPERLYFWFGEPIDPTPFGSSGDDDEAAQALREEVGARIEDGLDALLVRRGRDPRRALLSRLLRADADPQGTRAPG